MVKMNKGTTLDNVIDDEIISQNIVSQRWADYEQIMRELCELIEQQAWNDKWLALTLLHLSTWTMYISTLSK